MGGSGSKNKEGSMARALAKESIRAPGTEDIEDKIRKAFEEWDTDGSGQISLQELSTVLTILDPKIKKQDIQKLLEAADTDSSGSLDLNELMDYMFSTPNLEAFFETQMEILRTALWKANEQKEIIDRTNEQGDALRKANNMAAEIIEEMHAACTKQLKPLIEAAFDHHDKDGSGVIESDEAKAFFVNLAKHLAMHLDDARDFADIMISGSSDKSRLLALAENKQDMRIGERITNKNEQAAFIANLKTSTCVAFKVVDTRPDGVIQKDELVTALMPGTPENVALMTAFGIQLAAARDD